MNRPCTSRLAAMRQYQQCLAGVEPAEVLTVKDREALLTYLASCNWSVTEIAVHTKQTDYTVSRILARVRHDTRKGAAA